MKETELTKEEFEDFNKIVTETLNALIDCADKHNIDRDSFVRYFCAIFGTMAEVSTFEGYKRRADNEQKQIDIIRDLLTEFDDMGFIPTTTVPDPEAYAIKWRAEITKALEDYFKQSEDVTDINVGNKSEWISVDERLPDDGVWVLGYSAKSGRGGLCNCLKSYVREFGNYDDTTHWLPLPEFPKKKGE